MGERAMTASETRWPMSRASPSHALSSEVHIGHTAIRGFYANLLGVKSEAEMLTLRALGHEAAFYWQVTVEVGEDTRMRMDIISTMTFADDGKIASMKAYWGPENVISAR